MRGTHFQLSIFISQIDRKLTDAENTKNCSIVTFAYSTSYFEYIPKSNE